MNIGDHATEWVGDRRGLVDLLSMLLKCFPNLIQDILKMDQWAFDNKLQMKVANATAKYFPTL